MKTRWLLIGLLVVPVACSKKPEPAPPPASQPAAQQPVQPATPPAPLTPEQRWFALVPDSVKIRKGACPFECCTYQSWIAREPIALYARERDTNSPIATIPKAERFQAITGNVHILAGAIVAIGQRTPVYPDTAILPGDTVVVLNHTGEDYYDVWLRDGRVYNVEGNWEPYSKSSKNHQIGKTISEWWVSVKRANGQAGWINANTAKFGNADRCGTPE